MLSLHPKSVALIGASDDESKLGHMILKNLIDGTFAGDIIPVNPKHDFILGKKCAKDIALMKGTIDLAIIVTPASTVLSIVEECGKKKVKIVLIISAGFSETGTAEGKHAEEELKRMGTTYDMTIIGPNCLGMLLPHIGLNASFAKTPTHTGNIALISQSGAMAVALLDIADREQLGFSAVFSIGNKAATDEADLLQILAKDEKTDVIGLYTESIHDGEKFVDAARALSMKKKIVLLKAGTSNAGARAVSSHTGALAGSTAALDAACHSAGIVRAADTRSFLMTLRALSAGRTLPRKSIGILTNAGGLGVLATDAAEHHGLLLPSLSNKGASALKKVLPPAASIKNPIDVLGDAGADRYEAALKIAAADPEIEGLVCLLTPQVMTPCTEIAKAVIKISKTSPLLPIVTCFMGGDAVKEVNIRLQHAGILTTETPEEAVQMMAMLAETSLPEEKRVDAPTDDDRSSAAHGLLKNKAGHLPDTVTAELVSLYGLSMPEQAIARSEKEAASIAEAIGFPVVMKISAKGILHKTDIGGVRVNIQTKKDAEKAYRTITQNCEKHAPATGIEGVMVQAQVPAGSEFIVGAVRDPAFGPIVMVGLGGIYTELFTDTSFRLAPVSTKTALTMLTELRSWKLLLGLRGKSALNIESLAETIVQISTLISECEDITEIDLNPVLVDEKNVTVADAKIVMRERMEKNEM